MKKQCKHKFEARYDERPNVAELSAERMAPDMFRKLMYYKVYLFDICVRCGLKIDRSDNENNQN